MQGVEHFWSQSDGVGRAVALLLLAMSVAAWVLVLWKGWLLRRAAGDIARAVPAFWDAATLADGSARLAAMDRERVLLPLLDAVTAQPLVGTLEAAGQLESQLTRRLRDALHRGLAHLQFGQVLLASVGSTAPFVGLFGTVWGIYHALAGISAAGSLSIDKVSGPIGEALIMTAAGIAVAVPAVQPSTSSASGWRPARPSSRASRTTCGRWCWTSPRAHFVCAPQGLERASSWPRGSVPDRETRIRNRARWLDMAFGRLERNPASQPMSEINMTPLIDVMLVLLVIFIITAPLMTSSLKLDLPKAEAGSASDATTFVALAIDARGQFFLGETALDAATAREKISTRVREAARRDPATEVQLRADAAVPYGRVAELIGWVQEAGISRIGFVTETPAVR